MKPLAALILLASIAFAADQPQWGQLPSRNMVSAEKNLPDSFNPATGQGVKWVATIGTHCYATPIVAGGKVFIGTNNENPRDDKQKGDCGVLMCFDEKTGAFLWQLLVPKLEDDRYFDWPKTGWQSAPSVEGDRAYVVSNRAEVLCLDVNGMSNGNDGPFKDEGRHMTPRFAENLPVGEKDGDIIWAFDMVKDAGIWPHDGAHASILIDGPFLYLNTGNGVDNTHRRVRKPDAPSLIVLEKSTGRLVAFDDEKIGQRIFHATWSSPSMGTINGKKIVMFGGQDGVVYAFEALTEAPKDPVKLKKVWSFDCDPAGPKESIHRFTTNRSEGPSNILGMPVFLDGRVYVAAGGDLWWGKRKSWVKCFDAAGTGDITKSAELWSYEMPTHCIATPAVHEGLVYITDAARNIHCIDAKSGKNVWTQKTGNEFWASVMVADGKLYAGNRKGELWIMQAGREAKVLSTVELGSGIAGTVTPANGHLFIATMGKVFCVGR